jgi:hypothetical protein
MKWPVQAKSALSMSNRVPGFWRASHRGVTAMDKFVDELHNKEDASSLGRSLMLFFGLLLGLGVLGAIFWSAF